MARPRKYETPDKLAKAIDSYFNSIDAHNQSNPGDKQYYTWPGLCLFLGVHRETMEVWIKEKDKYKGYLEPIKRAELRIQNNLEQQLRHESNKSAAAIFLLKQPHYGGYTDRPGNDGGTVTVKVDIAGIKGDEAFG